MAQLWCRSVKECDATEMGEHWALCIHKFHLEILQDFTLSLEATKDVTNHVHQSHRNAAVLHEKVCSEDFRHELVPELR